MRKDLAILVEVITTHGMNINNLLEIGSRDGTDVEILKNKLQINDDKCYIIEAHPFLYDSIVKKYPKFNVFHYAVTDEYVDIIEFNAKKVKDNGVGAGLSSVLRRNNKIKGNDINSDIKEIPATRIDTFMKERGLTKFDLIKIDAEGYSYQVLKSFGEYLENTKIIEIEAEEVSYWDNQYLINDVKEFMIDMGFELIKEIGDKQKNLFYIKRN